MRGFRGSRAAQLLSSRNGRHDQPRPLHVTNGQGPGAHAGPGPQGVSLPEWMKTPETKAREAAEAKQHIYEQAHPKAVIQPVAKPAAKKPELRLVKSAPAAPKASAPAKPASERLVRAKAPKAAKAKKAPARALAAKPARTIKRAVAAKRRKAA